MLMGEPVVGARSKLFGDPMAGLPPDMLRMLPPPSAAQSTDADTMRQPQTTVAAGTRTPTAADFAPPTTVAPARTADPLSMDTITGPSANPPRMLPDASRLNRAAQVLGGRSPLGASLQQPIDYEKMRADMMDMGGKEPSKWQKAAMVIAPMLMALGGNQAGANAAIQNFMEQRRDFERRRMRVNEQIADWRYKDYARQNEADLRAADPFSSGRDRVMYDPSTGQSRVIYDGPEDWQTYADNLNTEPGSPEYFRAVEDYVLKSAGPSAYDRGVSLDDHRTGNDIKLEGERQDNRREMEGLRQSNRMTTRGSPTYRDLHPTSRAGGREKIVDVATPADAMKLPVGTKFRTPDGQILVR